MVNVAATSHEGFRILVRDVYAAADSAKLRYVRRFNERVGAAAVVCVETKAHLVLKVSQK